MKSKKETLSGKKVQKGKKKKPIRLDLQAGFDKSGKLATVRMFFGPHNFIRVGAIDGKAHMAIGVTHHGKVYDVSTVPGGVEDLLCCRSQGTFPTDSIDDPFDDNKDIKWVTIRGLDANKKIKLRP